MSFGAGFADLGVGGSVESHVEPALQPVAGDSSAARLEGAGSVSCRESDLGGEAGVAVRLYEGVRDDEGSEAVAVGEAGAHVGDSAGDLCARLVELGVEASDPYDAPSGNSCWWATSGLTTSASPVRGRINNPSPDSSLSVCTTSTASSRFVSTDDTDTDTVRVTVVRGDTLWGLARTHLGSGLRWSEIFALNKGVVQADGRALTDPNLILIGWVLELPSAIS